MWKLEVATGNDPWLDSLCGFSGRQIWEFDPSLGTADERAAVEAARARFAQTRLEKKHSSDELMRLQALRTRPAPTLPPIPSLEGKGEVPEETVNVMLQRAMGFYSTLQNDDGHWAGDYGGPMFLMPGLVIGLHVTNSINVVLTEEHRKEMKRYLYNHQNEDGGWGLHIEGHSTMFGSALNYVALRLLGEGPEGGPGNAMLRARAWILAHGGVTHCTSWGKFWLSVLGVYEWEGNNPLPPEFWLLPYILPVHPGRFWCHCRMVYLPMCYLYGRRAVGPPSPLVEALKQELYSQPYSRVDWDLARNQCAKEDLYYPHPFVQDCMWWTLQHLVEPLLMTWPGTLLRGAALQHVMEHVHYEDENTRYVCIGPVNKVINMVCCYFEDPDSEAFKKHLPRVKDYLWVAEDGMKMQGYNGSQLWDTSFTVQALFATGLLDEAAGMLHKAHQYIEQCQVQEDCPGDLQKWYRHISKGAWPFSTRDHGWPITDCSAEGLKAALLLATLPEEKVGPAIPADRLYDCINVILSFQNSGGGWATYENTRGSPWLELLNPAETFGDIIIDYSYVELSSAAMQALTAFAKHYPNHRASEIREAVRRGAEYIKGIQKDDGSWHGSWGVCFTYGTWFGIEGLRAAGASWDTCPEMQRATGFLLGKQLPNGGWGESYLSCQDKVYSPLPENDAHCVQTAWALLGLIEAGQAARDPEPLHKAARFLMSRQMANGDFPQEEISGVFNLNCMISYSAYRNIFPIWALGLYRTKVLKGHPSA